MSRKQQRAFWPILFTTALGASLFVFKPVTGFGPSRASTSLTIPSPPQSQTRVARVATRLITLQPNGFEPNQFTNTKGPFFLVVGNRSGIPDVTLRIDREVGGRVKEVQGNVRKKRWSGLLDLPPGRYILSEVNHPDWVCRFTISPQ